MKEERFPEALSAFKEAHRLAPSPRTAAQKGLAEQAMHLWIPAAAHIRLALEVGDDVWIKKNRVFLEEAVAEIEKHIGTVSLGLPPAVHEIRLTAAGEWIPWTPPSPVRLPEGEITLEARAPGFASWRRTVVVRPNVVLQIPVDLTAVQLESPPTALTSMPAAPVAGSSLAAPAPAWLVVSMAIVGAGAALYGAYLVAIDGRASCDTPLSCSPRETRTSGAILVGAGTAVGLGAVVIGSW
jgi:hypothetical protein